MRQFASIARLALGCCAVASLLACGSGGGGGVDTPGPSSQDGPRADASLQSAITYHGDIRNIIEAKCVTCHREGGSAPFSLAGFEEVKGKRSALVFAVESGSMPPAGYAALTPGERTIMLEWLGHPNLAEGTPADRPATAFTWWRDTRPIVEKRCALCHVENGLAPFPLQSWNDVIGIREAALYSIRNDTMPPWNPSNGYTGIRNNLSLTREEKAILVDWLAGGAPEGHPEQMITEDPASLEQVDWELSLRMPVPYTPTVFPDEYRCFVVDWPKQEASYITASTFLPQFAAEIHHVFVTIIPPNSVAAYKAAERLDGKPGYACFGDTRIPGELPTSPPADVLGWGPGINSKRLPAGTGIQIAPGSALALQIHFNTLTSEPMPEQSEMVFVTAPAVERPGATAYILDIANWIFAENMLIPAGEDNVSFQYEMPVDELKSIYNRPEVGVGPGEGIAIHRASLHMHTLGKSSRLSLVRADGSEQVLLDARHWDFDWQSKYLLEEEVVARPGDFIRTQCVYDNTAQNQPVFDGEALPVRDIRWGDKTTDEMCASTLFFTRVAGLPETAPTVYIGRPEMWESFAPGALMPVELRLNNFVLEPPGDDHKDANGQLPLHGHYHVYFDTDDENAEHVTDWRQQPVIRLPETMSPGIHRLRVSLRSGDHEPVGVEDSVEFRVTDASADPVKALSLIDHTRWEVRAAGDDPFYEHRPADVDCPPSAWGVEGGALEVETGVCNYLALQQPSLVSVAKGERIRLVLWHQQLRHEQPGRAHVALAIGGDMAWQQTVPIPSDGQFYDVVIESPVDLAAGGSVDFHLHNHGFNSWTLLSLEKMPARQ